MSFHNNPFIRGYWGLHVQRVLEITSRRNHPAWLPLHPLQEHLPDRDVVWKSCFICNDHVIVGPAEDLSEALSADCRQYGCEHGLVTDARYTMFADDDGQSVCLGDVPFLGQANEIIHRLAFREGFCRCWEISAAHLEAAAIDYLKSKADAPEALGFFSAFHVAGGGVGVRLAGAPRSDSTPRTRYDASDVESWLAHREQGMPLSLAKVLLLAEEADVRILIFDGVASQLCGLPIHDPD